MILTATIILTSEGLYMDTGPCLGTSEYYLDREETFKVEIHRKSSMHLEWINLQACKLTSLLTFTLWCTTRVPLSLGPHMPSHLKVSLWKHKLLIAQAQRGWERPSYLSTEFPLTIVLVLSEDFAWSLDDRHQDDLLGSLHSYQYHQFKDHALTELSMIVLLF